MDLNLVDFRNPPLVEVSIGIQFADLPIRTADIGNFRKRFAEQLFLDKYDEQQPLEPRFETFGSAQRRFPEIRVETLPTLPRQWFSSDDGTRLVQLQRDRFIYNWRRATNEEYHRYPIVKKSFGESFAVFVDVLENILPCDQNLLKINQCELAYFNHIESGGVWSTHSEVDKVITSIDHSILKQSGLEDVRYGFRKQILNDETSEPIGRIYVNVTPAFRAVDSKPLISVDITARGKPNADNIESTLNFFDNSHLEITQLFVDLTSSQMHEEWGRLK